PASTQALYRPAVTSVASIDTGLEGDAVTATEWAFTFAVARDGWVADATAMWRMISVSRVGFAKRIRFTLRGAPPTSNRQGRWSQGGGRPREAGMRCPRRTALSMKPASASVCSPANLMRGRPARRAGQNGTIWRGPYTA